MDPKIADQATTMTALRSGRDRLVTDQATAVTALRTVRDKLAIAQMKADEKMDALRDTIVRIRPTGVLPVDTMADAIGRDRNYVDSVWSIYGETQQGKQTRAYPADPVGDPDAAKAAEDALKAAAKAQRDSARSVKTARSERDVVVAMVYASKLLGPTAISAEVDVDRNHVLRIARKAGVAPMHRQGSRNQYSTGAQSPGATAA